MSDYAWLIRPTGSTSVNAIEFANQKIDHSAYIDSRPVVERIDKELGLYAQENVGLQFLKSSCWLDGSQNR